MKNNSTTASTPMKAKRALVLQNASAGGITAPASGTPQDTAGTDPPTVMVNVQITNPSYTQVRARCFEPSQNVTVATGAHDGYTLLDLTTFSGNVPVVAIAIGSAPSRNNNKVAAWGLDSDAESGTWDPIEVVYFKAYDSSIVIPSGVPDKEKASKKA